MRKEKKNSKRLQTPRPKKLAGEKLSRYVQHLFEQRGKKASETAKKAILEEAETIKYEPVKEALRYLASYWTDTTRPALLSIACEAAGGNPKAADPIAAPLTLICEAVDLHDDVIDQSVKKKNHLTLYGKFGKDLTLLMGDALLFKGFTMLNEAEPRIPHEKMQTILHVMNDLFFELGEAETLEMSFRHKLDLKPDRYLSMAKGKAADFEAYMRISAILANASEKETEALARYGRILGILAILGDDNSDVFDSNELMNRVSNEALPFPILLALEKAKLHDEILPVLRKGEITRTDANHILDLIDSKGIFETVGKYMKDYIREGKELVKDIKDGNTLRLILESTYPE
jgi:geranylgeranyl pyrophosphate synthase